MSSTSSLSLIVTTSYVSNVHSRANLVGDDQNPEDGKLCGVIMTTETLNRCAMQSMQQECRRGKPEKMRSSKLVGVSNNVRL